LLEARNPSNPGVSGIDGVVSLEKLRGETVIIESKFGDVRNT
jgi:hypothetical protein